MAMRRGYDPTIPMPATLSRDAWLVVEDAQGRALRSEHLPPGTDLPKRLADEAAEYAAQGWTGRPLPGHWTFIVRKGAQSLVVGIRASRPGGIGSG
jgi:hypothetical protein